MIFIKEGTLKKINNWNDNSIHIVTDFDRTLTTGNSESSWGILSKSGLVTKEYMDERQKLYDYYRPIEIDEEMDYETKNRLMTEWWNKHIGLLIKYKMSEEIINKAANDIRVMEFRKGAKEFLKNMKERDIPVIIISAGIGNFVKQFLIKNQCDYDNIFIVSNFIKFENGIASGIIGNVTHSLNKNEVSLPSNVSKLIENRPNIILLGDNVSDVRMAKDEGRNKALKIGFLEEKVEENKKHFEDNFDIVCTDNTGFDELSNKISILK